MVISLLIERCEKRKKYFRNWRFYCMKIKEEARKFFGENLIGVFVFGSVLQEEYHVMLSDIDVAIVLKKDVDWKEKMQFKSIISNIFSDNPFEIHIITEDIWKNWYLRFVDKYIEV